jgi:4'-phosphopantetheinyl transferase EntD
LLDEDVAIAVAPDRAPVMPPGVRASLAHDRRFAVAALSRADGVRSLGLDIEPVTELSAEMAAVIVRPEEASIDAHLAFTLKEAAYKAWSRLGGRMLEFDEVRLAVGADSFEAEVLHAGVTFAGRFTRAADRWIALVVVRDDDDRRQKAGRHP